MSTFFGAAMLACSAQVTSNETIGISEEAVSQAFEQSFELSFYSGTDAKTTALLASGTLKIADNVRVIEGSDATRYAPLENTGAGTTEIGAGAKVGGLLSAANVSLRSNSTVYGDVRSSGKIETQAGARVTGAMQAYATPAELRKHRFTVKWPAVTASIVLDPKKTAAIATNTGYGSIVLNSGSYVALGAGQYYTDLLQLEPDASLKIDTRNGPVVLWVKNQLNYKGKIDLTGPEGAFMIGYLGTSATSLEKAISATVVAPNATLRLAPIGSPGWRGSFFAKSIDAAEAGSTVTHRAFDYWQQYQTLKPIVHCVRRSVGSGAALLGYENRSAAAVAIPIGPDNRFGPASSVQPPTTFQPGLQPRLLWVPFELTTGLVWTLSGTQVAVDATTPSCELGDVAPGDAAGPPTDTVRLIDAPGPLPVHLQAVKLPNHVTAAMTGVDVAPTPTRYVNPNLLSSTSSAGTSTGYSAEDVAVAVQAQTAATAGLINYTFKVTNFLFDESEGLCGQIDPYAKITIDGKAFGAGWEATAQLPNDKKSVKVHVEIWDDDDFPCGGDDFVTSLDLDVDLYNATTGSPSGFFGIYWSSTPTRQPKLCMDWNAQFLDSGPWNGLGKEDYSATRDLHQIPASYARASVEVANDSTPDPQFPLFRWTGVLDSDGCLAEKDLPPITTWKLGTGLKVKMRLFTEHCLDPLETNCANKEGVNVATRFPVVNPDKTLSVYVRELCQVIAEDPNTASIPNCSVRRIPWTKLPPQPWRINYAVPQYGTVPPYFGIPHDPTTRAAAAVSQVLRRETESDGGLGVVLGMAKCRYQGTSSLTILTDTYCAFGLNQTTCTAYDATLGNTLFIEPEGDRAEDLTRFKYAVTHEFGHHVATAGMGDLVTDYGKGPGMAGVDPKCQCAHLPTAEQGHCLQSLERPNAAQQEGFAQFFAAKVWNKDLESDCVFVHGKHFLNDNCMPGVESCLPNPNGSGFVNQFPVPVSCHNSVKWRNNHCLGPSPSPDLLASGTEYDWLEFYYAINNNPVESERFTMADIFRAYLKTCGELAPGVTVGCNAGSISWVGAPEVPNVDPTKVIPKHESLIAGVNAAFGETSAKARAFARDGIAYGVSSQL